MLLKDFTTAYRLATEFIENPCWLKYWKKPECLFKSLGWIVISYKRSEHHKLTNEAYSSYKNGKFFILYSCENYKTRTNYNFHHESGHIIAAHPIKYGNILCKSSQNTEKRFLEEEATIIGRNVFLPAYIIKYILIKTKNDVENVKKYFQEKYILSQEYINVRFEYLDIDFKNMSYPKNIEREARREYLLFSIWLSSKKGNVIF
ncbi:hypothetical protein [Fusobacterium necrophorum]|uniref:hypothetical protein n=1 Tax=Fusobacterium necrophorum TaxID=859 RepID=UPI000AB6B88B|nr:hypothetical protein [Fusobacterium necrophorum]